MPGSIFLPEARPAAKLPIPMPRLRAARRWLLCASSTRRMSVAYKTMFSNSREPRNQKKGVGDDGGPERRVAPHAANFMKKFGGDVPIETAGGISGRNFADAEACQETEHGESEKDDAGPNLASMKGLGQKTSGESGADGGEQGAEFDDAVAPAQLGYRQQLGEQAVFCWAKDCALCAGQKQSDAGDVEAIACERVRCQAHDAELEEFCPQCNAALAVLVREVSSRDGENQEGNGEKQRHDKYKPEIAALFRERGVEDQESDEPFEGVVAEGALELHRDERPESGEAARLNCGLRLGLAR